jgi:hypothetical protein
VGVQANAQVAMMAKKRFDELDLVICVPPGLFPAAANSQAKRLA